jgi:hypothetical protein
MHAPADRTNYPRPHTSAVALPARVLRCGPPHDARVAQAEAQGTAVILINPLLQDRQSSGGVMSVRGRSERLAFAASFEEIYQSYTRPHRTDRPPPALRSRAPSLEATGVRSTCGQLPLALFGYHVHVPCAGGSAHGAPLSTSRGVGAAAHVSALRNPPAITLPAPYVRHPTWLHDGRLEAAPPTPRTSSLQPVTLRRYVLFQRRESDGAECYEPIGSFGDREPTTDEITSLVPRTVRKRRTVHLGGGGEGWDDDVDADEPLPASVAERGGALPPSAVDKFAPPSW